MRRVNCPVCNQRLLDQEAAIHGKIKAKCQKCRHIVTSEFLGTEIVSQDCHGHSKDDEE